MLKHTQVSKILNVFVQKPVTFLIGSLKILQGMVCFTIIWEMALQMAALGEIWYLPHHQMDHIMIF